MIGVSGHVAAQCATGESYLVLVGWVELVPGLWVVLLVPEAANVERFRACRIKGGKRKREETGHEDEKGMHDERGTHDGGKEKHKGQMQRKGRLGGEKQTEM